MDDCMRQRLRDAGFRPFTNPDWLALATVWGDEPWAYVDDVTLTVLDEIGVKIFPMEDDQCGPCFVRMFLTESEAMYFAIASSKQRVLALYVDRINDNSFRLTP
jgi:hypothetical protein